MLAGALPGAAPLPSRSEARFDLLTRTAQRVFGVAIAAVCHVDEEGLGLKSLVGSDLAGAEPLRALFRHAHEDPMVRVMPDTWQDPRFAASPMRFFASHPLWSRTARRVGTLCLFDPAPRGFTEDDRLALADLAGLAQGDSDGGPMGPRISNFELLEATLDAQDYLGVGRVFTDGQRIDLANDAFCQLSGYSLEELTTLPGGLEGLIFSEPRPSASGIPAFHAHEGPHPWPFVETVLRTKAGGRAHVDIGVYSVGSPDSQRFLCLVRDNTQRVLTLKALQESEGRYRQLVEQSPSMIAVHCEGRIVFINQAGCKLLKAAGPEDLIGKPIMDLIRPESREWAARRVQGVLAGEGASSLGQTQILCQDGTSLDVEVVGAPIKFQGQVAVQVLVRDITERLRLAENLARSERLLAEAERLAGLGSWAVSSPESEQIWSDHLFHLFGLEPQQVAPSLETFAAMVHPDDRPAFLESVGRLGGGQNSSSTELRIIRKDGVIRHLLCKTEIVRDEQGRSTKALGITLDITERKELERLKDSFLAAISHEMRTPLTTLQFSLDLFAQGALDLDSPRGEALLRAAQNNTDQLVRLVNDLLEIERLESGQVPLEIRPCEGERLLRQALESLGPDVEAAGATVTIEAEPVTLHADPMRLTQVLSNLLSNALKFSPQGATFLLSVAKDGQDAHFTVRDSGRGIPSDKLETIFERFQQVRSADFHVNKGVGLGLSICRGIVRQHGGRIWAQSTEGSGSSFHFTLPCAEKVTQ